jgi:hypothetical protein
MTAAEKEEKASKSSLSSSFSSSSSTPTLNFVVPPSDYSSVLINGELQGRLVRGGTANLTLPALENEKLLKTRSSTASSSSIVLDVVVEAMGRRNFGCDPPLGAWDTKGLQSTDVRLNGKLLFTFLLFSLSSRQLFFFFLVCSRP